MKEIVEVMQLVPQECIQHQEQLVVGETSQNIEDIPTVQDQMIVQEIPEVQIVERIQEQIVKTIKLFHMVERVQQRIVNSVRTTTPAVMSSRLFVNGRSECFAKRLPRSTKRVSLMSEEEVECYVNEFERAGGDAVFSTSDALEGILAASSGWTQTMFEQQILDCDMSDLGCDGGWQKQSQN